MIAPHPFRPYYAPLLEERLRGGGPHRPEGLLRPGELARRFSAVVASAARHGRQGPVRKNADGSPRYEAPPDRLRARHASSSCATK